MYFFSVGEGQKDSFPTKGDLVGAQDEVNLPQAAADGVCCQKMKARVVKQHKAICQVLSADRNYHLVPSWQEIDLLKSMSEFKSTLKVHRS